MLIPENRKFEQPSVKYHVISLVLKMTESIETYLNRSKSWPNIDQNILKTSLSNHIQRNFPDVDLILSDWDEKDADLSVSDYLDTSLDLLEKYKILTPKMLEESYVTFDLKEFLTKYETIVDESHLRRLQVKAVKLFLDLEPALFRPKTDLFEMVVSFSLEFYYNFKDAKVLEMLNRLLKNTGIFDGCLFEIDLWIDGILNLKSYDADLAVFFCGLVKKVDENSVVYNKKLFEMKGANFSPLLIALDCVETKALKNYLSFVILNLFHLQVDTTAFVETVSNFEFLGNDLINYIQKWDHLEVTEMPKYKGKLLERFYKFSTDFLNGNLDSFDFDLYPNFKLNLLQCAIFYVTNLIKADMLKENQVKNTLKLISCFISDDTFNDDRYVKTILGHPTLLRNLTLFDAQDFSTKLILDVVKGAKSTEQYLVDFRRKVVSMICKVFRKSDKYENSSISIEVIETVALDYNQCRKLIEKFVNSLESKRFYQVACYCLDRMSELAKNDYNLEPLSNEVINKLSHLLTILLDDQISNSSNLSLSLLNYLKVFPHNLEGVESKLFDSLLKVTEFNKDNLALSEFLLDRKSELITNFENNLDGICSKRSFILYLLDKVIEMCHEDALLEKIFNKCESYIIKALQKPHKAGQHFQNRYHSLGILIDKFMKPENFGAQIQKFETCELFHVFLLKKIYGKVDKNEKVLNNMIMTFLHLIMSLLKQKATKNVENLNEIAEIVWDFLHEVDKEKFDMTFLSSNETFKMFCKLCLKYGLTGDFVLVKILTELVDFCVVEEDAKLILEMLLSHSQFLDVILGDYQKDEILNLWLILCRKWPQFMERSHIPVLLSAYKATNTDKTILILLKM